MEVILQIYSLNVRGINSKNKRLAIFEWLKTNHTGIIFLQETHSVENIERTWIEEWGSDIKFCHGSSNSKGVAILLNKNLDIEIIETIKDNTGRMILIYCKIFDTPYTLINVYCPTKDDQKTQLVFLDFIQDTIETYGRENIILGGDFNTYLNTDLDKKGGKLERQSIYSEKLNILMESQNLVDIWRIRNPQKHRYTWREKCKNGIVQSRLDYFLVSMHLEYVITKTNIYPSIKSDHSIVSLTIICRGEQKRGRGFWKMNIKYLKDLDFVKFLKEIINEAKEDSKNIKDRSKIWDYIKCRIRTECIDYGIKKSKEQKSLENSLIERISLLEEKLGTSINTEVLDELNLVKTELDFIYNDKAMGSIIRSRCQWIEENEKSSKFFLNLEKQNYKTKHIRSLMVNNSMVNEAPIILESVKDFYQDLYQEKNCSSPEEIKKYLSGINCPKIKPENRLLCDSPFTEEEYNKALKDLPNNKTPGQDGIPIEFYKVMWHDIKDLLVENYNLSKIKGELPMNQGNGIISLVPKNGKDIREIKNWRPITLLNSDYKILTKILANRLKRVLTDIINTDQIGYMKSRFCGENTRLIADIIEYTQIYKKAGILLLVDFEKAFDTISWDFLHQVLEFYNFGPSFIDWIKIIYNNVSSCVTNNGYASKSFSIKRGIRQGDPVSALLFLPVVEVLAAKIRNEKEVKGFTIDSVEIKLCQLADDTTLFLKDNKSVKMVIKIFEEFYRYAGLKLNKSKTVAIILWNDGTIYNDLSLKIQWDNKPFKTLGIWYSLNIEEMIELNIKDKLFNIQSLLRLWSMRKLSLRGKITVLKSLVMPHILSIAAVLFLSDNTIKKIEKLFFDFLWSTRKHGIAKNIIIQPIELGGFKMISITNMIKSTKVMWIKRLLNNTRAKWKSISWLFLDISAEDLFSRNHFKILQTKCKSNFYRQTLKIWNEFISIGPQNKQEILNENLFNNSFILIENKPITSGFEVLKHVNIKKMCDIVTADQNYILDRTSLNELYNIDLHCMDYNKLISAIPLKWKKAIAKRDSRPCSKIHTEIHTNLDLSFLSNKKVYNIFTSFMYKVPNSENKWIESYPFLEGTNWSNIYTLPYKVCRDTFSQSLQYKILHRYLNCNYNLYTWKIRDSSLCSNCSEIDTIEHFLFLCEKVKAFWYSIERWIKQITGVDIQFTVLEIIFGIQCDNIHSFLCNFIILQAKCFVYQCRKYNKDFFFLEFLCRIKQRLMLEKEISREKDNTDQFDEKFGLIFDAL